MQQSHVSRRIDRTVIAAHQNDRVARLDRTFRIDRRRRAEAIADSTVTSGRDEAPGGIEHLGEGSPWLLLGPSFDLSPRSGSTKNVRPCSEARGSSQPAATSNATAPDAEIATSPKMSAQANRCALTVAP